MYRDGEEFPPRELRDRLAVAYRVLRQLAPADEPPGGDDWGTSNTFAGGRTAA